MSVVDRIVVCALAAALGKRRQEKHADWTIAIGAAIFGFIPDDEERAACLVFRRIRDERDVLLQPSVAAQSVVRGLVRIARVSLLVPVMTNIRRYKVVPG